MKNNLTCEFFIYFGDQALVWGIIGKYVFPYFSFSLYFNAVFFSHEEAFYFEDIPFVYTSLYVPCSGGQISVKILMHGMSEIFLPMFSSRTFMVLRLVFHTPWIYFCVWCKLVIEFHFFACSCPDIPTPYFEKAIFALFYAPSPFVKY